MSTSDKIPATDRSRGGPGSSHVDSSGKHKDFAGARHQNHEVDRKHPSGEHNGGGAGNRHEKHEIGEGRRS
ncbi:hypothetical protein [Rhizosaccharibacter radicis]|uniref:Stress-induced protein n=1 Tax=Rhizosaccharibacter radicis TaxID=2782605 RepID=A0ABT1W0L0_9PROT|nr:hypothetical protein [Acetobacteraceae bacterium KSS12]